jgi:Fungal specific transcription factor domain
MDQLEEQVRLLTEETNQLRQELKRQRELSIVAERSPNYPETIQVGDVLPKVVHSADLGHASESIASDIGLLSLEVTSEKRYVGASSGVHFGKILQAILPHTEYQHEQRSSGYGWNLKTSRSSETGTSLYGSTVPNIALPAPEVAAKLRDTFFACRWPSLPFLHLEHFCAKHYDSVMRLHGEASHVSLFLVYMVFAIGSIDIQRQNEDFAKDHLAYFQTAMTYHLEALAAGENTDCIQGLLLMAMFAVNEPQSLNAWHVAGLALRMAIDSGMHHGDGPGSGNNLFQTEMRKRIFWAAYALDRNVSIALGRPLAIRDADITISLPLPLSDKELLQGLDTPFSEPHARPPSNLDLSTFIHVVKIRQLNSKIQDVFYATTPFPGSPEHLEEHRNELRARLDDWIATSPRYSSPNICTFQSMEWFQIAYFHALLLLYRPSPTTPTVSLEGLRVCAESSISLISAYSSLYAKNKITCTWVALHSLFMASITMLYTLWVGQDIRSGTTKAVVKSNVTSCLALFEVMGERWPIAERCYYVVNRLGIATVKLFEAPKAPVDQSTDVTLENFPQREDEVHFGEINLEYMEWFGTREKTRLQPSNTNALGTTNSLNVDDTNGCAVDGSFHGENQLAGPPTQGTEFASDWDNFLAVEFDMNLPLMTSVFDHDPTSTVT